MSVCHNSQWHSGTTGFCTTWNVLKAHDTVPNTPPPPKEIRSLQVCNVVGFYFILLGEIVSNSLKKSRELESSLIFAK
jgi:hypothetical protein